MRIPRKTERENGMSRGFWALLTCFQMAFSLDSLEAQKTKRHIMSVTSMDIDPPAPALHYSERTMKKQPVLDHWIPFSCSPFDSAELFGTC